MLSYFAVLCLTIFWWFNLVNVLLLVSMLSSSFSLGSKIHYLQIHQKIKTKDEKKRTLDNNEEQFIIDDQKVVEQKQYFDSILLSFSLRKRIKQWNLNYIILALALILIYPSEFLIDF